VKGEGFAGQKDMMSAKLVWIAGATKTIGSVGKTACRSNATGVLSMRADQNGIIRQALAEAGMQGCKRLRGRQPVADIRLVGHDDDQEADRL
jgi:hypothetical protein